jgi:hypothetical protein
MARKTAAEIKIRQKSKGVTLATATEEIYQKHLEAFDAMRSMPEGSIRERDVPWPNPMNLVFLTPKDDANAKKKKILRAIGRWHPDKFTAAYGSRLREDEREAIMARVRSVSASIIELRQVFN